MNINDMKLSDIIAENYLLGSKLNEPKYKILVLSNIVTTQLNEILEYSLRKSDINAHVTTGNYDNIVQETSKKQDYNLIIIFWEASNIIDGFYYKYDLLSEDFLSNISLKIQSEIQLVFENLSSTPKILFNKFSATAFTQKNIKKTKLEYFCDNLNSYIIKNCPNNTSLIDIEKIFGIVSLDNSIDWRFFYTSKAMYSVQFYKEYSNFIKPIILSILGKSKKVLIMDCDNTLWKGILGEVGFNGIEMSSLSKHGIFFEEVQYMLEKLAMNGVIICLASKNNPEDIDNVFLNHPDIILKNSLITCKKVNWKDKASNIKEISEELNLGLDSFVFIDDSDFEINLVKQNLPQVHCIQVPKKLHEYPSVFRENQILFFKQNDSEEDRNKVIMYQQERIREVEKQRFLNIDEYLKSLGLKLIVFINSESLIDRIAQLTQKTNQFNLTNKRYTETEIKLLTISSDVHVFAFSLADKFGNYGTTGVAIIRKDTSKAVAYIDTFLMSCRVIGRNAELVFADCIMKILKTENILFVQGYYVKSQKNFQVENFYTQLGFEALECEDTKKIYKIDLQSYNNHNIEYFEVLLNGK